jgi:hypothetical protein
LDAERRQLGGGEQAVLLGGGGENGVTGPLRRSGHGVSVSRDRRAALATYADPVDEFRDESRVCCALSNQRHFQ